MTSEENRPVKVERIHVVIALFIGIIIGGILGLFWMVYYLEEMKQEGVYPRDDIIEYLNRELNKDYEYEKGDEYITPVYISGVEYFENGTMIKPPICYGPTCPYNFTGVVRK